MLISLMQCALNKTAINKLMLMVSEKRWLRLLELAKEHKDVGTLT